MTLRLLGSLLATILLVGCADFHSNAPPSRDAGAPAQDAAVPRDAEAPVEECAPIACPCAMLCTDGHATCAACPPGGLCDPHAFMGCSSAESQWYWNGASCEAIVECRGTGEPTRRSCLASHLACSTELDVEERTFVLLDMRRSCTPSDAPAWSFTFIPREDALLGSSEPVALGLREGLDAPTSVVSVVVIGALDPFHELASFEVGDRDLEIELCESGTCGDATEGTFAFEIGGAGLGSLAIDVRFGLEPVAVDLGETWFAYDVGAEAPCWR